MSSQACMAICRAGFFLSWNNSSLKMIHELCSEKEVRRRFSMGKARRMSR